MIYVPFGKRSGLKVGRVSLGAMRFGTDPEKAVKTIRAAIDGGVNYIDTSPYYLDSKSEELIGLALKDGYREKVLVSSKMSMNRNAKLRDHTAKKVRETIDQSLRRMQLDYLDYFQFWLVYNYENFKAMCAPNRHLAAIKQAMKEGVVKHTGITGHPPAGHFPKMFRNRIFEICTLSYNYLNREMEKDIRALSKMGVGVVVMNPASGGTLAQKSPVLERLVPGKKRKSIETAYRYVLSVPGVSTIIAGMDTSPHAREDCRIGQMKPLTVKQRRIVNSKVTDLRRRGKKNCTACDYCKKCPKEIRISRIFTMYNRATIFGLKGLAKREYKGYLSGKGWIKGGQIQECTECGKCEKACPNGIPVISQLKRTHKLLKPRGSE